MTALSILKSIILSPRQIPSDMKLVRLTKKQAEWAAMAPSVAGGWVATMQVCEADPLYPTGKIALVPARWTDGDPVDLRDVQQWWADDIHLEDAAAKIGALPAA